MALPRPHLLKDLIARHREQPRQHRAARSVQTPGIAQQGEKRLLYSFGGNVGISAEAQIEACRRR